MRVVYLNPGGAIGGAEMVLLDLLAALAGARPDLEPAVVLGEDGPLRAEVDAMGLPCEVLPLPSGVARLGDAGARGPARLLALGGRLARSAGAASSYRGRLARRLRGLRPDLVHSNGMKMHLLGAWSAPSGVPVVWHLHDYVGPRPVMARLLRLSARPGVEGAAISGSVASDARRALGGRFRVTTILNAVDTDRFRDGPGDGPALDRAAGLPEAPEGAVRVGLVATFAAWKGHGLFLEAASRVPAGLPARFYVVGGPIYSTTGSEATAEGLRGQADRLGLAGRVGFTGHMGDPAEAIRALDVVVHASTRPEPFGRVIVEAMACGRPVVAMAEGGAAELFDDGEDALGCPPRDPDALAAAISRLVSDAGLRARLGSAGRRSALARFDRSRLAGEWSPLYDRACAPGAARGRSPAIPARPRATGRTTR